MIGDQYWGQQPPPRMMWHPPHWGPPPPQFGPPPRQFCPHPGWGFRPRLPPHMCPPLPHGPYPPQRMRYPAPPNCARKYIITR